jgi:hypothetical protein
MFFFCDVLFGGIFHRIVLGDILFGGKAGKDENLRKNLRRLKEMEKRKLFT